MLKRIWYWLRTTKAQRQRAFDQTLRDAYVPMLGHLMYHKPETKGL